MLVESYIEDIESASKIVQIILGIVISIVVTLISRLILRGPLLNAISSSDNLYDDRIFNLATPILNTGVFLVGIWLTFHLIFEEGSFERSAFAGGSAAIFVMRVGMRCAIGQCFREGDGQQHLFGQVTSKTPKRCAKGVGNSVKLKINK